MKARIYQPTRTAMQSGQAKTHAWLLEFAPDAPLFIDPLMGWTGMTDTTQEVKLWFESEEEAIAYAEKNGIAYEAPGKKKLKVIKPKSYAGNFSFYNVA